jgi:cytochrome c oxidase subunit II
MNNSSSNTWLHELVNSRGREVRVMSFRSSFITICMCAIAAGGAWTTGGATQPPRTISITASRFAFDPHEITIKKGEEVTLAIQSKDVSHGLVIEDLGVRTEVKKGQTTDVKFTPEAVGVFEGKCAHFCGKGHGSMTLTVHVVE